jgi:oxidoreductase family protein
MVRHSVSADRLRSHNLNLVECCMSGCAVCVHDLYQEFLDDYNASVVALRASLTDMNVPEEEWPETIRPRAEKQISLPASNPSLSAFREMERVLEARREAQAHS